MLFAFNPDRSAVFLVAGDKLGTWRRWHEKNTPAADDLFDDHLRRRKEK